MKVKDLLQYGEDKEILLMAGGRIQDNILVEESENGTHILLLGEADSRPYVKYSREDLGCVIRGMIYGLSDESIAKAIGKSPESVRKKRKEMETGKKK